MHAFWVGIYTSGVMVCILACGSIRDIRRRC
jgi:hypothetical protein